ncbi:MAG TPA: Ig-like domain-containing protein, partial [Polyangiaceae bacterium]|nr:Ig-like domain-containing protein [Polyangiaceae bacterium]
QDGGATPLLGQEPGQTVNCGTPCYGAAWQNPLELDNGTFSAGYAVTRNGVQWKPVIVTMLHGRSLADAQMLIDSAKQAEQQGGAKGRFLFMDAADSARGVLDTTYPGVINALKAAGFTDAQEVPYNSSLTGQTLAAFFTGTASIGTTIEGNTYLPGSLVDNLTSFGAVPQNFAPTGETQVSISRWVEKGVGGVHGTVDEPLNNVFPDRALIVDYVKGAPLGEAYFRHLPYQYWKNLVLGDPMLAPYAKRPAVTITGLADGATAADATMVTASATDSTGAGIAKVQLFVDGVLAAEAAADTVSACVKLPAAAGVQVLAVAQTNAGAGALAKFPPKGWAAIHATGLAGGNSTCASGEAGLDGGGEGGDDGGTGGGGQGGCSCRAEGVAGVTPWGAIGIALAAVFVRARRPRGSSTRRRG